MMKLVRFSHQVVHRLLDQHFGAGIDRTGRFVEDQHLRVGEDGAGNRQQLLLPLRDIAGLLVEHRVVTVGQCPHEVVDVGGLRGGDHFLVGCV